MAASKKFSACTVFYGEESYLLDRELQKGKGWPDRNVKELDGEEAGEAELISALESLPFDGSGIVVVLDNAHKVKVGAAFEAYWAARDPKDTTAVLVAIYRKPDVSGGWSLAGQRGRLIEHRKYKPWEKELILKRLYKEADLLGRVLTADAAASLLRVHGESLGSAVNEIQKLSFLVGVGGDITKEHVLSVCPRQVPVMPWDVSDAVCKKALKQALMYTAVLFKTSGDEVAIPVVASLMRQTERLLVGRSVLDAGGGKDEVGSALGMKPYAVEKQLLPVLGKHSTASLKMQMEKLCELEMKIKGGAQSKRTLIELAVHQFTAAA